MGVAHHAAYIVWLEAARVEWMRDRGLSYRELEASGVSMAVARVDVRYRRAARFDDELRIDCSLVALRSRFGRFTYRIFDDGGGRVAEATTDHVPTDRSGRAVRLPAGWRAALADHIQE